MCEAWCSRMTLKFIPKGYTGHRHETIGSDIVALYSLLSMPEQVLGQERAKSLTKIVPHTWYPIETLIDLMEVLGEKIGDYGLMRMGRNLFEMSHQERVVKEAHSASDIVYGFNSMYRHANRGTGIGGWSVKAFAPGTATLQKTTPHHCKMEQGILAASLKAVGCTTNITQSRCLRQGDECCVFEITSLVVDERWMGKKR